MNVKRCCCCLAQNAGQFYSLTALMCSIDKKWACKTDVTVQEQHDYDFLVDRLVAIHLQGSANDMIEQCVCVNCYSFKRLNLRWRDPQTARQWRAGRRSLPDDGYRWVNLGKAKMKGAKHQRIYYKCKHPCCPARKHVDRNPDDEEEFTVTYTGGDHLHRDWGNGQWMAPPTNTGYGHDDGEEDGDDSAYDEQAGPSQSTKGSHTMHQTHLAWHPGMHGQGGVVQGAAGLPPVYGVAAGKKRGAASQESQLPLTALSDANGRCHTAQYKIPRSAQTHQPLPNQQQQGVAQWHGGHGVSGVTLPGHAQAHVILGGYVGGTGKAAVLSSASHNEGAHVTLNSHQGDAHLGKSTSHDPEPGDESEVPEAQQEQQLHKAVVSVV